MQWIKISRRISPNPPPNRKLRRSLRLLRKPRPRRRQRILRSPRFKCSLRPCSRRCLAPVSPRASINTGNSKVTNMRSRPTRLVPIRLISFQRKTERFVSSRSFSMFCPLWGWQCSSFRCFGPSLRAFGHGISTKGSVPIRFSSAFWICCSSISFRASCCFARRKTHSLQSPLSGDCKRNSTVETVSMFAAGYGNGGWMQPPFLLMGYGQGDGSMTGGSIGQDSWPLRILENLFYVHEYLHALII